jgi:hypothetical protein
MTVNRSGPIPEAPVPRLPGVDYYPIIVEAIGSLTANTPEVRHAIYTSARDVVQRSLLALRPQVSMDLVEVELAYLDTTIEQIEQEQLKATARPALAPAPAPSTDPISPTDDDDVPVFNRRIDLPELHSFRTGPLRLLGLGVAMLAGSLLWWAASVLVTSFEKASSGTSSHAATMPAGPVAAAASPAAEPAPAAGPAPVIDVMFSSDTLEQTRVPLK